MPRCSLAPRVRPATSDARPSCATCAQTRSDLVCASRRRVMPRCSVGPHVRPVTSDARPSCATCAQTMSDLVLVLGASRQRVMPRCSPRAASSSSYVRRSAILREMRTNHVRLGFGFGCVATACDAAMLPRAASSSRYVRRWGFASTWLVAYKTSELRLDTDRSPGGLAPDRARLVEWPSKVLSQ